MDMFVPQMPSAVSPAPYTEFRADCIALIYAVLQADPQIPSTVRPALNLLFSAFCAVFIGEEPVHTAVPVVTHVDGGVMSPPEPLIQVTML